MIIRKIIILTVLGGQAIFIAGLLLLIFLRCIAQLEVREESEEVENLWGKVDRGKGDRGGSRAWRWESVWGRIPKRMCVAQSNTDKGRQSERHRQGVHYVRLCLCVCLRSVCGRNHCEDPPNSDSSRRGLRATRLTQWPQLWEPLTGGKQDTDITTRTCTGQDYSRKGHVELLDGSFFRKWQCCVMCRLKGRFNTGKHLCADGLKRGRRWDCLMDNTSTWMKQNGR